MDSGRLSPKALDVIASYRSFSCLGIAPFSVPYYNNRRGKIRAGLRAWVGKGSPSDICEEIELLLLREKTLASTYSAETIKQFLVDRHIGIDCSGFVFHVLSAENTARGFSSLRSHLSFPYSSGLRKIFTSFRTAENSDVRIFAHNSNSKIIPLKEIAAGDFITMSHTKPEDKTHDHIILVHEVLRENGAVKEIRYTHSVAWPTDGRYHHGVQEGAIQITDPTISITEQIWIEREKTGSDNFTYGRAKNANLTEIRRLRWF